MAELAESDAPLAQALDVGAGINWAASLTAFGAVVAITSVILAMYYGQTRIFFAMARDGLMPERLAEVSPRRGVPVKLTIGFGIIMSLLAALVPLDELVKLVNIGTLFAFLLVSVGVDRAAAHAPRHAAAVPGAVGAGHCPRSGSSC